MVWAITAAALAALAGLAAARAASGTERRLRRALYSRALSARTSGSTDRMTRSSPNPSDRHPPDRQELVREYRTRSSTPAAPGCALTSAWPRGWCRHYPLETFIAVNPLAGLEDMPFEQAIRRAGDLYGMTGTLGEAAFRGLHAEGRITDADLDRALTRRYPIQVSATGVRIDGRELGALEILRAELLHGIGEPTAKRRLASERLAPAVIEAVDRPDLEVVRRLLRWRRLA